MGAGAIAEMIAATRERLAASGLLGVRRRKLPRLPAAIGVVCGADAAVRRDIESVVAARFPGYPLVFEETTVSGPGASFSIVEALRTLLENDEVGVVILARGGGDAPSLLPWSSEEVCRAVSACPVPVVSAIGHEGDRPLCDEVADLRCGTPSLAATAVVPDRDALSVQVGSCLARASASLAAHLEGCERRVARVDAWRVLERRVGASQARLENGRLRLGAAHPSPLLRSWRHRLGALDWRRPAWEAMGRADGRLAADLRHLRALSPARTLERGYSVVVGPDGSVLRSASGLAAGDRLGVRFAHGGVAAEVTSVHLDAVGRDD